MTKQFGGAPNFAPNAKPSHKAGKSTKSSAAFDKDYDDWMSGKQKGTKVTGGYQRCYETHPPLKLPNSELVIYGGSCINPAVTDADVYIGFDCGMKIGRQAYPWIDGESFLFTITDMRAPSNPADFKALVDWTIAQLNAGRKVHAGCIGGHGRTGTFFAALVATMGETDAITYVREHYCKKAVESTEQISFLHTHYGVKKVAGSKSGGYSGGSSKFQTVSGGKSNASIDDGPRSFAPLHTVTSIWGKRRGKAA